MIFLLPHFWRKSKAAGLAKELIEAETGRFEPAKMPDKYAETLRELLQAKIEQRAPHIEIATESKAKPEVVNIMAALKESMQERTRQGAGCGAETRERGEAESLTTEAKPAPDGGLTFPEQNAQSPD